jgi:hypothetical protein
LNLSFNAIEGELADLLPWEFLSGLKLLSMSGNFIRGCIPNDMAKLEVLEECYLGSNQLRGCLPEVVGPRHLKRLRVIVLSENLFSGSLEPLFADAGEGLLPLERLDVFGNGFDDCAWRAVLQAGRKHRLSNLETLDIRSNAFYELEASDIAIRLGHVLSKTCELFV